MVTATELFLDQYQKHGGNAQQKTPITWVGKCLAHEDNVSSLSFGQGKDSLVAKCFAGCTFADIMRSVGLEERDGFDNKKDQTFDYRHNGKVVRRVIRTVGKKFRQEVIDGSVVPLYIPDTVTDFAGVTVWVPEGEKDADFLSRYGVPAVTSPGGAASWAKADYTPLKTAKNVVVVADNDEPGVKRALELAEHLKKLDIAVKVVRPAGGLKDATDHILQGYELGDFEIIDIPQYDPFEDDVNEQVSRMLIIEEAKKRVREIISVMEPKRLQAKALEQLLNIDVSYDWVVEGLLERRDRFVLTGFEGSGKSLLLRQMSLSMASGLHPFDIHRHIDPLKVLVVDAENTEQQWARSAKHIVGITDRLGKNSARQSVHVQAGMRLDFTTQHDVNEVHRLIDEHQPDVMYLGPLYKLVPKEITTDDDAAPLLVALDAFRERGIVLLMEAHAGHAKGHGGKRDLRPRGSSALLGWPEFGYGLRRDEDSEIAELQPWRGDREKRDWPKHLRVGQFREGELPWMPTVNI